KTVNAVPPGHFEAFPNGPGMVVCYRLVLRVFFEGMANQRKESVHDTADVSAGPRAENQRTIDVTDSARSPSQRVGRWCALRLRSRWRLPQDRDSGLAGRDIAGRGGRFDFREQLGWGTPY